MRNVIIYGINWTNCYALQSIFKQKYPEKCVKTCNSLTALLHSLSDMPDAGLILALNPHEHVYLFHALQTRLQNRKVLVVADRLYYIDRCVLQYFGVMDYVLKTNYPALSARIERAPSSEARCVSATGHKKKTVATTYALMPARRRKRYCLISINTPVESTSRRHSGEICAADIIILRHPAIELAKNLVWEQKPSVFIVRRLCIVWGWTLHRYRCSGD